LKGLFVNIKKISLAVAGALLVVGCASNQGVVKNAELRPDTDSIRPKPVSTVFHRPQGTMTITFDSKGEFLEITSKGTAPIAGNNAFSIEQAAQVAQLRAKRNIAEFISTQLQTTRSVKVLSTAVQKSLENTTNGMSEEVKIDDKDFDANGNPVIINAYNDGSKDTAPKPVVEGNPNTNSEKIAEIVRENITTSSSALIRGAVITDEKIDQAGRTIVVEIKTGTSTVKAANELRKLMGSN
jgi:PBP1b-binding outer membrane lipoprotein LpoB